MSRALIALLTFSACAPGTGSVDQPIIGGQTATNAEFPTVVVLENARDWSCTGTLIDKGWVLSAAHCVEGETATTLKIRFDDANLNDTTGGNVVAVAAIHAKPGWVDPVWDNDIALIELASAITDREPTPVERSPLAPATSVTAVGYGDSDNNGNGSGILRKVTSTTIDCAATHDPALSGANLLCFDPTSGHASCDGDSGGPAFVTVDGKLRVAGINSGNTGNTCTTGWELYTSVAGEIDFIDMYLPPGSPDPDEPGPDGGSDTNPVKSDAGCRVASGDAGTAVIAMLLVLGCRRRRVPAKRR